MQWWMCVCVFAMRDWIFCKKNANFFRYNFIHWSSSVWWRWWWWDGYVSALGAATGAASMPTVTTMMEPSPSCERKLWHGPGIQIAADIDRSLHGIDPQNSIKLCLAADEELGTIGYPDSNNVLALCIICCQASFCILHWKCANQRRCFLYLQVGFELVFGYTQACAPHG